MLYTSLHQNAKLQNCEYAKKNYTKNRQKTSGKTIFQVLRIKKACNDDFYNNINYAFRKLSLITVEAKFLNYLADNTFV